MSLNWEAHDQDGRQPNVFVSHCVYCSNLITYRAPAGWQSSTGTYVCVARAGQNHLPATMWIPEDWGNNVDMPAEALAAARIGHRPHSLVSSRRTWQHIDMCGTVEVWGYGEPATLRRVK